MTQITIFIGGIRQSWVVKMALFYLHPVPRAETIRNDCGPETNEAEAFAITSTEAWPWSMVSTDIKFDTNTCINAYNP